MASSDRVFVGRQPHAARDHFPVPRPASTRVTAVLPPGAGPYDAVGTPGERPVVRVADDVLEAALASLEAQKQGAFREAHERGYADGIARAEGELGAAIGAVRALARSLETAIPRDVDMVSRTVAELAVLITRRIIGAELRSDPSVLVAAIENGLRHAIGASVIHVELHPDTVDAVEATWTARHGTSHRGFSWSFAADPELPLGGCRLRSQHGVVEAGFDAQLSEVAAALDAAIPGYLSSALGPEKEPAPDEPQPAVTATAAVPSTVADFGAAAAITAVAPAVDVARPSGLVRDDGTVVPFGQVVPDFGAPEGSPAPAVLPVAPAALPGLADDDLAALADGPVLSPDQVAALLELAGGPQ